MKNILAVIAVLLTITGGVYAGITVFATNERVDKECAAIKKDYTAMSEAIKKEVELVSMRQQQFILNDRIKQIQSRIWSLEDRYQKTQRWSPKDRDEYRQLKLELDMLKRQYDKMGRK